MRLWRGLLLTAGGSFTWLSLSVLARLRDTVEPSKLLVAQGAVTILGGSVILLGLLLPVISRRLEALLSARLAVARGYPSRRDGRTGKLEIGVAAALVAAMILLAWVARSAPDLLTRLVAEDGPVEYATAIAYLIAAALTARAALGSRRRRLLAVNLGLLAALMFVVAMEEISWGQRLIGFGSPALLVQANVQSEFNFHNIWSTSVTQIGGLMVSGTILALMPLLHATTWWFRAATRVLQIPVASLSVSALYGASLVAFVSVGGSLGTLGVGPFSTSGRPPHLDDEVFEVLLAGLFLMASLSTWSVDVAALRAGTTPGAGTAASAGNGTLPYRRPAPRTAETIETIDGDPNSSPARRIA